MSYYHKAITVSEFVSKLVNHFANFVYKALLVHGVVAMGTVVVLYDYEGAPCAYCSSGLSLQLSTDHQMIPVNMFTTNRKNRTTDIASDMTAPNHSGLRICINP